MKGKDVEMMQTNATARSASRTRDKKHTTKDSWPVKRARTVIYHRMNPKSAKSKGKLLEDWVADQIIAKGIDPRARRENSSGAGNREKGDVWTSMMICGQNAGIECKNQKTLAIPEWWRQTKKLESLGREPVLVFKFHGEPLETAKVVIYLDTLLELVKNQAQEGKMGSISRDNPKLDRQAIYELENAARAIKRVEKVIKDILE